MKYTVAFLVIASVAAGNLRASKYDNDPSTSLMEAKDIVPANNRDLQMGMETTMMGEKSAIIEAKKADDTQDKSQQMKQLLQKATVKGRDTPATDIQLKDDPSDIDTNSNIDVRIVGGDVSDANEFPYYGTSILLLLAISR